MNQRRRRRLELERWQANNEFAVLNSILAEQARFARWVLKNHPGLSPESKRIMRAAKRRDAMLTQPRFFEFKEVKS